MLESLIETTNRAQNKLVNVLKYVALEYQIRMSTEMRELQTVAQSKRLETGKLGCIAFADSLQRCNTLLSDVIHTGEFNLGLLQDALSGDCDPDAVIIAVEGAQKKQRRRGENIASKTVKKTISEEKLSLTRQSSRKPMVASYALESHGIKGVHIPAVSLRRFYDHWKRSCYFSATPTAFNTSISTRLGSQSSGGSSSSPSLLLKQSSKERRAPVASPLHADLYRGPTFQEYLLLYPYKSAAEIYLLMTTSPARSASLQDAHLLGGVSSSLVEYWHTPEVCSLSRVFFFFVQSHSQTHTQDRKPFQVVFHKFEDKEPHRKTSDLQLNTEADPDTPETAMSPKVIRIRADAEEASVATRRGGALLKWLADGAERLETHRHRQNELVGTGQMCTFASGKGVAMVVMRDGKNEGMYIHSHIKDRFHHSSIFAGEPVHFAGEIKVSQGRIEWISNKSGHYQPGLRETFGVLEFLQNQGCNLKSFACDLVDRPEVRNLFSVQLEKSLNHHLKFVEKRSDQGNPVKYIRVNPAMYLVNAIRKKFGGSVSPRGRGTSVSSLGSGSGTPTFGNGSPLAQRMSPFASHQQRQRGRSIEWAAKRSNYRRRSSSFRNLSPRQSCGLRPLKRKPNSDISVRSSLSPSSVFSTRTTINKEGKSEDGDDVILVVAD